MSAHVLLNLLNESRKRDKNLGFFRNELNKFNNTRAGMLTSGVKRYDFVIMYEMFIWTSFYNVTKICKPLAVY